MVSKRALAVLLFSLVLASGVVAQSAVSSEFGRASGGEIGAIAKHRSGLSGSLGITSSQSMLPFGSGGSSAKRYGATLGGTVVKDRIWFFASAEQSDALFGSRFSPVTPANTPPDDAMSRSIDASLGMQMGSRQNLAAMFASRRGFDATPALNPSSFLSLHYTGIVSPNMFFTSSFTRQSVTQPDVWFTGAPR